MFGKKKLAALGLAVVLCGSVLVSAGRASAAAGPKIVVDGRAVEFTGDLGTPFFDANGRTQVPLRAAMEAMGAKVDWDAGVRTAVVSKGSVTVRVPIGAEFVFINGEKKTNDTAAVALNGRTYLPIRIVAEALGADVAWEQATQTVRITTHGDPVAWVRCGESEYVDGEYSDSYAYGIEGKFVTERSNDYEIYLYEYNERDQLTTEYYGFDAGYDGLDITVTTYSYNNFGLCTYELSNTTDGETGELYPGYEAWYEYNSKGDVTKELYHSLYDDSWSQTDYSYLYDSNGRISKMTAKYANMEEAYTETHSYRYDGYGRLVEEESETYASGEVRDMYYSEYFSYGYDVYGNLVRMSTYEEGQYYSYTDEVRYSYRQV